MPTDLDDTEIMSRYLQRGATMLGEHCDDCNNPLFRVQGEETCVVCRTREAEDERSRTDDERRGGEASGSAGDAAAPGETRDAGGERGDGHPDATDHDAALAGPSDDAVAEIRRDVLAVARRVAREARDERELARLRDQMAVLESCADVLDDLE